MRKSTRTLIAGALASVFAVTTLGAAVADPPSWAPAWGHRAKHGHKYKHEYQAVAPVPAVIDAGRCNREVLGAVLGGATGGLLGANVGKGDGRTAAVIGGAVLGLLVGGSIGRSMDRVDQNCVGQVLERAPSHQPVVWRNPDRSAEYRVVPVRTYQQPSGQYCREYQTTAVVNGREQRAYGTACRQPDGSWRIVSQ